MSDNSLDFRLFFEALPGHLLLLLPDAPHYTIVAANDEALRVTNKQRQDVVGKSIFEVYPANLDEVTATGPSHIKSSLDTVLSTKEQNRLPHIRYDVLNTDGVFEARYWSPLHKPILDQAGEVSYIIHAPIEVTEQINAEKKQQELSKTERKYNLFMQAPVAVFIVSGPEHTVELANDAFLRLLGKTPDIIGKPLFASIPEAASQGFPELLEQVRKTGEPYYATEYPTKVTLDGIDELRYYNFVYQPYYANPGDKTPIGVISSGHNVTELVLSRKRIEESESRFKSLIEESPVPTMLLKGKEFTIEIANEAMIRILGKGDTLLGKSFIKALPELEGQPFLQLLDHVFTSGIAYEAKSAKAPVVRDGIPGIFYFDYTYKPLFNAEGEVHAIINTAVDVTDKVVAEKQLEERKAYLQSAIDIGELGTFKVDLETDTGAYSETVKQWFGLPDLEQPMEVILSRIHPEDLQSVMDGLAESTQNEDNARHDFIYRTYAANKQIRHLRSIGRTIFIDGQPKSITGLIQDVSPVTAQLRLKESESRFRSMIQQAPIGICLTRGREVIYESINAPMLHIIGKTNADEVLGKKIADVVPGITTQSVFKTVVKVFDTGESYSGSEVPIELMIDGSLDMYYFNLSYTPLVEVGKITGVLHVAIDVTEQVAVRQRLEENEQFIRSMVESAPFPISVFAGQEIKIQFANQTIKEIWGKGNDVEGKLFKDVLPELMESPIFEQITGVFSSGQPYHTKNQPVQLLEDGKMQPPSYFNYSFTPLFNAAGTVTGVMSSAADVTDLNQARQAIEISEARFRNMVQQAPVAILLMRSPELIIEVANAPFLKSIDKDQSVIGKRVLDVLPELEGHPILEIIHRIFETGDPFTGYEIPGTIIVDGSPVLGYYNTTYTAIFEDGMVSGILQVATDVTEQVLSRKELEESQEELKRFKFMADQARDAFILMREDGTFAYLNPKALDAWGYTEEEAKSIRVPDVNPIYEDALYAHTFALAQNDNLPQLETLHKKKDGRTFPVEISMGRVVLGNEPHLFAVARDITERKQAEEAMELKNAELIRINNDLDNFIYTASHDLKAPISNIEALLHALIETLPEEILEFDRTQRITNLMQDSVDRFKKTIANLTEVVKLQKENNEEAVSVNLDVVVREVLLDLDPMIQYSGADIEINVEECPKIFFSEKNLRSVIYNLLSNGIKYRSPDRPPKLEISCKKLQDFHVLTISDNGLGLKENQLAKLFSMFKRFHDHVEGTGIGLYMVKKMMENVGGQIKVESKEGIGTTFSVYFPA